RGALGVQGTHTWVTGPGPGLDGLAPTILAPHDRFHQLSAVGQAVGVADQPHTTWGLLGARPRTYDTPAQIRDIVQTRARPRDLPVHERVGHPLLADGVSRVQRVVTNGLLTLGQEGPCGEVVELAHQPCSTRQVFVVEVASVVDRGAAQHGVDQPVL